MGTFILIVGLTLMATSVIKRYGRIAKGQEKIFGGYTSNEATIQWLGGAITIIGIIIICSS